MAWYTIVHVAVAALVTRQDIAVAIASMSDAAAKVVRESDGVRLLADSIVPMSIGRNGTATLAVDGKTATHLLWSNVVTRAPRYDGRYIVARDATKLEAFAKSYAAASGTRIASEVKVRTAAQGEHVVTAYNAVYGKPAAAPKTAAPKAPAPKAPKAPKAAATKAAATIETAAPKTAAPIA